ncbi:kinase-like protein [Athelia psychrophila]|uniref:Kinase-like protein n=1 Tax=Athelia psychrophila TaxID=1759441 RepID=A0A166HKK8_9AGAM|nr:kinase-like protein [Fibularhizoctonia sp. CBS 109695]
MHDYHSIYMVSFYGAFLSDPNICICMEFMDKGSLDGIYKKIGAIDIDVVAHVAIAVLEGLTYIYDVHRIIHWTSNPPTFCAIRRARSRIAISAFPANSVTQSRTPLLAHQLTRPERIQGAPCTVGSDVWSLGISLGRFLFSDSDNDDSDLSALRFREHPLPRTPPLCPQPAQNQKPTKQKRTNQGRGSAGRRNDDEHSGAVAAHHRYPKEAQDFLDSCLFKGPDERKNPKDLLQHEWILKARAGNLDLETWASTF